MNSPTGNDLRTTCEWLANHISGISLMDWSPCANVILQAASALDDLSARIQELEGAILNYLRECDIPAPDYAYRHHLRERMRAVLNGGNGQ